MANISGGYFTVNGDSDNCISSPYDVIKVRCDATFSVFELGSKYKAEMKITLPDGSSFSYYTDYQTVGFFGSLTFESQEFVAPVLPGIYKTVWFVIYDINGIAVSQNDGKGTGNCETLTVSNCPKGTKYRRGYFADCDKGYHTCDEITTGYCCCGINPSPGEGVPWATYGLVGGIVVGVVGAVYISSQIQSRGFNVNIQNPTKGEGN